MPGDVSPFQAQWNLRPQIDALRAEAKTLRQQNNENYKTTETDLAITRDRLAREQYGVEQQAKSADIQVGVETKEVQRIADGIAKREASMAAAEKRGDKAKVQEDREDIAAWRAEQATHEARARQATLDAAELREQAAGIDRQRTELSIERDDLAKQAGKVEAELDKMEQQADTLQQARLKYAEADSATDVGKRAALELEAEALVTKAGAIEVDRSIIRVMIPELPDTTPGIDADPGPLPPGAEEVSTTGPSDEDDAVASTDPDATGDGTESGTEDTMSPTSDENDVRDEAGVATAAGAGNTLDEEVFVDTAGGAMVGTSASDTTLSGGDDFGDGAGFGSTGADQPAAAAYTDTTGVEDSTGYEGGGFEDTTGYENNGGYEAPVYEEPAPAYAEDSYASSDFSAPPEAETGYTEPSYDTESYEG